MAYVLVGPSVGETSTLSEDEYKTLRNALELARSEDKDARAIRYALDGCTEERRAIQKRLRDRVGVFLFFLLGGFGDHCDEVQGMLVEKGEEPIFMLEDEGTEHVAALKALLRILESGGWLAGFLFAHRLEQWSEKTPTPLEVMQALTEEAVNFESDINDAKKLMTQWPALFPSQAETESVQAVHVAGN